MNGIRIGAERDRAVRIISARLATTQERKRHESQSKTISDELRPEYNCDYSKAVRGKYYKRILDEGANVVMLEPDVAKAFVDSASVNDALRSLLDLTRTTQRLTKRSSRRVIARRRV